MFSNLGARVGGRVAAVGGIISVLGMLGVPACGSGSGKKTPPPMMPSAGGTGAFGVVTVDGKQKLYLPQSTRNAAGHAVVAVVDIGVGGNGVAGAPALIKDIDLGFADVTTTTGGDSTLVIAASTQNNRVYFIDPVTDTVLSTLTLPADFGRSSFSGGGGYVTGIAIDGVAKQAILSVWNGFALVDMATRTLGIVIPAAPVENFGFDSVRRRIIAPFYGCASSRGGTPSAAPPFCSTYLDPAGKVMSDGLNVIDLADNVVYTYQASLGAGGAGGAAVPSSSYITANHPVGGEPDAAAADPTTGRIVVSSESGGFQSIIDLADGVFDPVARTVTAPQMIMPYNDLEGVAIESQTHVAFWEGESSSDVAVADLTTTTAANPAVTVASMPALPTGGSWSNLGDPHGIAVTTGVASARAVGFVVSRDYKWVGRVDLTAFLAAPAVGTTGSSRKQVNAADFVKVVTYLDARTVIAGSGAGGMGGHGGGGAAGSGAAGGMGGHGGASGAGGMGGRGGAGGAGGMGGHGGGGGTSAGGAGGRGGAAAAGGSSGRGGAGGIGGTGGLAGSAGSAGAGGYAGAIGGNGGAAGQAGAGQVGGAGVAGAGGVGP